MKTEKEFMQRLSSYKRNLFLKGERIGRDHPLLEPAVNLIAESYRLPMNPEYADLFTVTSHLTGSKINRFTHTPRSVDDLLKKSLALGLGAILVTEEKVKEVVQEMVSKGDVKVEEGETLARELFERMSKGKEEIEKKITEVVSKVLVKLDVPTRDDLKKLEKRITAVEKKK